MLDSEIDFEPLYPKRGKDKSEDGAQPILKKIKKKKIKLATPRTMSFSGWKKLQRRRSWKRTTVKVLAVMMVGVASGVMLGNWYKNYLTGLAFDYSNYKLEEYEMNRIAVLNSISGSNAQSENDFSNLVATLKSAGKTPKNLSASQNFALAEYTASLATSYSAVGIGKVATIATQDITSSKKFDGKTYTFESLSKGLLTIANCAVMDVGSSSVTVLKGSDLRLDGETGVYEATWAASGTQYPLKKYVELNGLEPSRLLPYVISSKTILEEASVEIVDGVWEEKPVFEFTVNLDPVTSVLRYYKQVMQTSGLKDAPKFDDVSIKFLIDADWNLVRTEVVEHYTVIYGVPAGCTGTLNTTYVFNEQVTLPIGGEQ